MAGSEKRNWQACRQACPATSAAGEQVRGDLPVETGLLRDSDWEPAGKRRELKDATDPLTARANVAILLPRAPGVAAPESKRPAVQALCCWS